MLGMRLFWSCLALCGIVFALSNVSCTQPQTGPKTCTYEHECKDNERCIYEDPSCVARSGQCKGVCQAQEPIPEQKCACQKDEDCAKYPFESCAACQCIQRNVIPCKTSADCIRGWYCVGEANAKICQARTSCKVNTDCPYGFECRNESCCNPETNRCPNACKEGTPCDDDLDCYFCNMRCRNNQCTFVSDACAGKKCTQDADCHTCQGTCHAGYCHGQDNPPTCHGKTCTQDADCSACNEVCKAGTCQPKSTTPPCTTKQCTQDADCAAIGLKSCIHSCCQ